MGLIGGMADTSIRADASRKPLWRHSNFVKLWLATSVSRLGSEFTGLAIPLIAVLVLGASPEQMGFLDGARFLPFLLIGLFAGVWADRHRKRPILITADLLRALLLLSIPVAALFGRLSLLQLYAIIFLVGGVTVFFDVSYQAFIPALVDREQLGDANGKLEAGRSAAKLLGPGLAGVVIQLVSAPLAILLDVSSFVISAALLGIIDRPEGTTSAKARAPVLVEAREGLGVVLKDPRLRPIVGCTASLNFFIMAVNALYVIYATRSLGLTPAALGVAIGIGSIGTLAGALFTGELANRIGVGPLLVLAAALVGAGHIPILIATPQNALPILTAGYIVFTLASVVYGIMMVSVRQALVPLPLQGRAAASVRVLVYGVIPLGGVVGGFAGQQLGIWTAILIFTIGMLVSPLWVLRASILSLRRLPEPEH